MRRLISVFIALFFAVALTIPVAAESRFCPGKDVWIIVQTTEGLYPLFLPKGELGETNTTCPETTSDLLIPVYDSRDRLVGELTVTLDKGYLDNPKNVYDKMPPNPNEPEKKTVPKPKKKRRIPPPDNIRTWHVNLPTSVD